MSAASTVVIRGGTIVDGSGGTPYEADLAVAGGRIAAIGPNLPRGEEEIDARGKIVTPGFVDVHTHYDAQVTWASRITPSSWNGVTTVMIGNCGVGFAPCLPHQREMLVKLMEGVEDIPEVVLTEGLPWNWQSFPDYLNALDARQYDLDVVTQVPHAALRVFVMGERGAAREPATDADNAAMARLAAEGIRAGALGFSTSRTINHKTLAGELIPTLKAEEAELSAIAEAVGQTGMGWLQVISDFDELDEEFAMLRRLVARAHRPMTLTVLQRDTKPEAWRRVMDHVAAANRDGLAITGQVIGRPTGIMLGFEITQNPFCGTPAWQTIAARPLAEKLVALRDPAFRARMLAEDIADPVLKKRVATWERIFPLGDPPDYEPGPEKSIAAMAARTNQSPAELAYDMLLERDGKTILYRPLSNYAYGDLETVREMITHPNSLIGLGDGGAHVGVLSDASALTYLLTHWTRDRTRGPKYPLAWAVKRLSRDNAAAIGLNDRGLLAVGKRADINVIDYDRLRLHPPHVVYDLPAGGRRMLQRTEGYEATLVNGTVVQRHGEATGALPGRLVRGARAG
jgi:N-acyl-D-aspartate/D-glutamate deacylase